MKEEKITIEKTCQWYRMLKNKIKQALTYNHLIKPLIKLSHPFD